MANLNRRTAYEHQRKDPGFSDAWFDAMEELNDELTQELFRQALGYDNLPNRGTRPTKKKNARLLIYLHNRTENKGRWKRRILDAGRAAIEVINIEGPKVGLSREQIEALTAGLLERLKRISLI